MADIKLGEPFGIDATCVGQIDFSLALARITQDLRSDFIHAPHLSFVYAKAGEELKDIVIKELKNGHFSPGIPLTIEVPKTYRIRVAAPAKRLGPSYSRPGSILLPKDRLLYQALVDQVAPIVDSKIDKSRSFSHLLAPPSSTSNMFLPTRTCWNRLQEAMGEYAKTASYILRLDVANFFGSLNQHTLINILNDAGYAKQFSSRLEAMLTSYTGERSSRGILQGMYPSDLLGNYYLTPVDRFLSDYGVKSARYVDDLYIFLESVDAADQLMRQLIPMLRSYDLTLNEAKSVIMPVSLLVTEEPDLEKLFAAAVQEVSEQINDEEFDADYGFQSEWEEDPPEEEDLELAATKVLFNSLSEYPGHEENIERFCLPLFWRSKSDYAVAHVLEAFKKRPSMSQIYAAYLVSFLNLTGVQEFLVNALSDPHLMDWQKMWILAALRQSGISNDDAVKSAQGLLKDANRHEALRATAAIYCGRYGDHARRKSLSSLYTSVSPYIQAAIYFSSRSWPGVERSNARASWGAHSALHALITNALSKK